MLGKGFRWVLASLRNNQKLGDRGLVLCRVLVRCRKMASGKGSQRVVHKKAKPRKDKTLCTKKVEGKIIKKHCRHSTRWSWKRERAAVALRGKRLRKTKTSEKDKKGSASTNQGL